MNTAKECTKQKPQYPARPSARSTAAVRIPIDERLIISGKPRPLYGKKTRNGKANELKFAICSYNARTVANDVNLNLIVHEKNKLRCDILGLCETRRKEVKDVKWEDGSYIKLRTGTGPARVGGIGFIVSKKWSANVTKCRIYSSRVGMLKLRLGKKSTLKVIQVYAPTTVCEEDELEEFYREIDESLKETTTYTVVMGDFNAKIGEKLAVKRK